MTIRNIDPLNASERRTFHERTILACILAEADNRGRSMVRDVTLDPSDFIDPQCAAIFEAMKNVDAGGAIPTTMTVYSDTMRSGLRLAQVIQDIEDNYWTSAGNLGFHVQALRKEIMADSIARINAQAAARLKAGEENDLVMSETKAKTDAINEQYGDYGGVQTLADFGATLIERARNRQSNPNAIQTFVPFIDNWIIAMLPGEYGCIAAYPSVGKSALALQIALSRASKGKITGLFSLEMDGESVAARGICSVSGADTRPLLRQPDRLTDDAQRAILMSEPVWQSLGAMVLFDGRRGVKIDQIGSRMKTFRRLGADMMILDYFQLVPGDGGDNRNQQLTEISRQLKILAGDLGVAIIVLSQFTKQAAKEKREATMHDLRDTAALEQDVDMLWILHHERTEEASGTDFIKLIQAKGRSVGTGTKRIVFRRRLQTFHEVEEQP